MKKVCLALAAATGILGGVASRLAMPVPTSAQTAAPSPFEAVSLKPQSEPFTFDKPFGCRRTDPSLFECKQATLRMMLMAAYGLKPYEIRGPGWYMTERYNLSARVQPGASDTKISTALQSLLTERFKIALHRATDPIPAYELTVAKGGPKLKEVDPAEVAAATAPTASPQGQATARAAVRSGAMPPVGAITNSVGADGSRTLRGKMQIPVIVNILTAALGKPVIDMTWLKGTYEIDLKYAVDEFDPSQVELRAALAADGRTSPSAPVDADTRLPNLPQAIKQSLGLEVTAKQLPIEILVIDQAEKTPIEN